MHGDLKLSYSASVGCWGGSFGTKMYIIFPTFVTISELRCFYTDSTSIIFIVDSYEMEKIPFNITCHLISLLAMTNKEIKFCPL
jgi:hypothetical protein